MSAINIFQISFEIWGCIISMIISILLGTFFFKTKDAVGKKLWAMILINNLLLVSDALAYIYRGDLSPIGVVMTRICNFALFALEYLLIVLFVRYVKYITSFNEVKAPKRWEYMAFILLAVGFIGLVITQFNDLYYSFDDTNHYQRENGIWISFTVCGAVILVCFFRLWLYRKKFSKSQISLFYLCIMIFLVCIIIQFIFYGLSLINIGVTISLILTYLRHYTLQFDLYVNNSVEEAVRDIQALYAWKNNSECVSEKTPEVQYEESKE